MPKDANGRAMDPAAAVACSGENAAELSPNRSPAQRLGNLAERINAEHGQAQQAARTAIEHAIECGRLLLEAHECARTSDASKIRTAP